MRLCTTQLCRALCLQGVPAQQYDAWDIGVTTNDCFGNADVLYPVTLPAVRDALTQARAERAHIPVVTGFLGRGQQTRAASDALKTLSTISHGDACRHVLCVCAASII